MRIFKMILVIAFMFSQLACVWHHDFVRESAPSLEVTKQTVPSTDPNAPHKEYNTIAQGQCVRLDKGIEIVHTAKGEQMRTEVTKEMPCVIKESSNDGLITEGALVDLHYIGLQEKMVDAGLGGYPQGYLMSPANIARMATLKYMSPPVHSAPSSQQPSGNATALDGRLDEVEKKAEKADKKSDLAIKTTKKVLDVVAPPSPEPDDEAEED